MIFRYLFPTLFSETTTRNGVPVFWFIHKKNIDASLKNIKLSLCKLSKVKDH